MHERKTLIIRNPRRPTQERLPVALTEAEQLATMRRTDAIDRTIDQLRATIEAVKARAKAEASAILEGIAELETERRELREQRLSGHEVRLVPCELLEDIGEGKLYVFRLDTMEVAQVRDMEPGELEELRKAPQLDLQDRPTRTVDVPSDIEAVARFDSDPPGVGVESEASAEGDGDGEVERPEGYGHEHDYDDGACITCGEADPDYEAPVEASKPTRRKRGQKQEGTGSAVKSKGRGYDTRVAGH